MSNDNNDIISTIIYDNNEIIITNFITTIRHKKTHNTHEQNHFIIWDEEEEEENERCGICHRKITVNMTNTDTGYWNLKFDAYICSPYEKNGCQYTYKQIYEARKNTELAIILREAKLSYKPIKHIKHQTRHRRQKSLILSEWKKIIK